jgi:hypothetical protein
MALPDLSALCLHDDDDASTGPFVRFVDPHTVADEGGVGGRTRSQRTALAREGRQVSFVSQEELQHGEELYQFPGSNTLHRIRDIYDYWVWRMRHGQSLNDPGAPNVVADPHELALVRAKLNGEPPPPRPPAAPAAPPAPPPRPPPIVDVHRRPTPQEVVASFGGPSAYTQSLRQFNRARDLGLLRALTPRPQQWAHGRPVEEAIERASSRAASPGWNAQGAATVGWFEEYFGYWRTFGDNNPNHPFSAVDLAYDYELHRSLASRLWRYVTYGVTERALYRLAGASDHGRNNFAALQLTVIVPRRAAYQAHVDPQSDIVVAPQAIVAIAVPGTSIGSRTLAKHLAGRDPVESPSSLARPEGEREYPAVRILREAGLHLDRELTARYMPTALDPDERSADPAIGLAGVFRMDGLGYSRANHNGHAALPLGDYAYRAQNYLFDVITHLLALDNDRADGQLGGIETLRRNRTPQMFSHRRDFPLPWHSGGAPTNRPVPEEERSTSWLRPGVLCHLLDRKRTFPTAPDWTSRRTAQDGPNPGAPDEAGWWERRPSWRILTVADGDSVPRRVRLEYVPGAIVASAEFVVASEDAFDWRPFENNYEDRHPEAHARRWTTRQA